MGNLIEKPFAPSIANCKLPITNSDRSFLAVLVQNLIHLVDGQVLVKVVVDLNRRSPAAGADALDFFKSEHSVGRGPFILDSQLFLAVLQQFLAADEHAGNIGADLNVVLSARLSC